MGSVRQETEKRRQKNAKEMHGAQKLTNSHEFTPDLWEEQVSNNFKKAALVTFDRNVDPQIHWCIGLHLRGMAYK